MINSFYIYKTNKKSYSGFLRLLFLKEEKKNHQRTNFETDVSEIIELLEDDVLIKKNYTLVNGNDSNIIIQKKISLDTKIFCLQISSNKKKYYLIGHRFFIIKKLSANYYSQESFVKTQSESNLYRLSLFLSYSKKAIDHKFAFETKNQNIKLISKNYRINSIDNNQHHVLLDYISHLIDSEDKILNIFFKKNRENLKSIILIKSDDIFISDFILSKQLFLEKILKNQNIVKKINNHYSLSVYVLLLYYCDVSIFEIEKSIRYIVYKNKISIKNMIVEELKQILIKKVSSIYLENIFLINKEDECIPHYVLFKEHQEMTQKVTIDVNELLVL